MPRRLGGPRAKASVSRAHSVRAGPDLVTRGQPLRLQQHHGRDYDQQLQCRPALTPVWLPRRRLERAHIPGPYVLAGHSFGGLYILTFAATYPDQVAGMVLLDSTAPVSGPAPPTNAGSYDLVGRVSALLPAVAHFGAARLVGQVSYGTLPPRARDEALARSATASHVGSFLNESREGAMAVQQAASLVDFAGKPLIVVTAGRGHDAAWLAAQDKLAKLSTNSRHNVVVNTTHASLVEYETDAAAASQPIRDVVASVRTSQLLT